MDGMEAGKHVRFMDNYGSVRTGRVERFDEKYVWVRLPGARRKITYSQIWGFV
jgi:hypothetical protein